MNQFNSSAQSRVQCLGKVRRCAMAMSTFAAILLVCAVPASRAENWTQWRGSEGQGVAKTTGVPRKWSESENIKWKTPIDGLGWSSPVIANEQIWVTTAETVESSPEEIKERKKTIINRQPITIVKEVKLFAVCLDRETGAQRHKIFLMSDHDPDPIHRDNSYASPTPVIDGKRLYCHFGTHGTACVDTNSGDVIWKNQTVRLNHENGPGGSPVVTDRLVIFHCDGIDRQFLTALDKETGEVAWQVNRSGELNPSPQLKKAYCTPLIVDFAGKSQLISPAANWVYGYDPKDGKELWKVAYGQLGFSNSSRPVFANDTIYVFTGFMKSRLLAIDTKTQKPEIKWTYDRQVSTVPSPVAVNGWLFFVSDQGVATCLDAKSGEKKWQERIEGNFWSSPIYAEGMLFFSNKAGETVVLAASDEFKELHRNKLDGIIMASPAAVDGALFVRTDKAVYRIQE